MSNSSGDIQISGDAKNSVLATGSNNIIFQVEQLMLHTAEQTRQKNLDPARMLRVLSMLAAPVYDPGAPDRSPTHLDLQQEWHVLAHEVRGSNAPILLTRLTPPTLKTLRSALSPRAWERNVFPHALHFSGHAWREGLVLEDDLGQMDSVTTSRLLEELKGLPNPLDLVVLNGCESAAEASSVAQALVDGGLARAAVGHMRAVLDPEAVAFAARLYAELTGGYTLKDSVDRAKRAVTTHDVILLGDATLRFQNLSGGDPLVDESRPWGNLPPRSGTFMGRGQELVDIASDLAHPPKVVVVSGPPGIGKSGLLKEVAHRNSWRFPGGVAYATAPRTEDAHYGTSDQLLKDLAEALGLNPKNGEDGEALLSYSATKPTLLLLDNLESLPQEEMARLRDFLSILGGESSALVALRLPLQILEELPDAVPRRMHSGLALEDAVCYVLSLARQRSVPLSQDQAQIIAGAVNGHPLLLEYFVFKSTKRDLDELIREVEERSGAFSTQIDRVYTWSADRLGESGREIWRALSLFPAGKAPEGPLRAATGQTGPNILRDAALADFDPQGQFWHWHSTVIEYGLNHWPFSQEERIIRMVSLLPAWTSWLQRLDAGDRLSLFRLETVRANLEAEVEVCAKSSYEVAWAFLDALERALPQPDRASNLRDMIAHVLYTKLQILPLDEEATRARLMNDLGVALSSLGQREAAIKPVEEAAEIYRKLAKVNPIMFLPHLASSLSNLAIHLSKMGRWKEALKFTQEAVKIYRELADINHQEFLPDLSMSLTNLSIRLFELGQRDEALERAQEATDIYSELARDNPQAFLPDLANSLSNLSVRLSELSRLEEALKPEQESFEIRRKLAKSNSQVFLPELAISLNNRALLLSKMGKRKEALEPALEAVDIRRELVKVYPQAFLPDLAVSLSNLGICLYGLERLEEALEPIQEAIEIYRQLAMTTPQAFMPDLAKSLGAYGTSLTGLERYIEAARTFAEGLQLIVPFYRAMPQAFTGLAYALERGYLKACSEAGLKPDSELLAQVQ